MTRLTDLGGWLASPAFASVIAVALTLGGLLVGIEPVGGDPDLLYRPIKTELAHALHAGTLGEYTPFPCGGDKRFLGVVGVAPDALSALIKAGASDQEVVAWVKANQAPTASEQLNAYRGELTQPSPPELGEYLKGAVDELAKARPDLDVSTIDSFSKLICVEEGHPIPSA